MSRAHVPEGSGRLEGLGVDLTLRKRDQEALAQTPDWVLATRSEIEKRLQQLTLEGNSKKREQEADALIRVLVDVEIRIEMAKEKIRNILKAAR